MKSFVFYFFLFFAPIACAQGWRQNFENLLNPAALCPTPDGGAAILANTIPGGPEGRQIVLNKTDQDGRVQWQKEFGASGDDEGRSLILTAAGQLAVAGKISYLANNGDALLALFDLSGQKLWEQSYNFGVLDDAKCVRQMPDGGFVLAVEADNQLRLLRTDAAGVELWSKPFPSTVGLIVKHLELRSDGGFVATLLWNNLPINAPSAVVLQINAVGDLEHELTMPHFSSYVTTDQVRCKPASDSSYWLMHRDSVYLLDQDTTVLKRWRLQSPFDLYLTDLIPSNDGGFFALGTNYSFSGTSFSRTYFARFREDGTEIWRRYFEAPSFLHASWAAERALDGGFFITGNYAKNGKYYSYLIRSDTLGQAFTNEITGHVFWDLNNDCMASPGELPMAGWLLKIERPNGDLHYANTDSSGHYHIEAGLGEHKISVLLPNGLWSAECTQDVQVVFDAPFQSDTVDFQIKSTTFCPLPRVDTGIDYWLLCAENTFVVRYSNAGSATAQNAAITLDLDSLLSLSSASLPFNQSGPHSWQFQLGDLPPLTDGFFRVQVQLDCDQETLDRTLCIEAKIEPDGPCLSPINGPLLVAEGTCEGDSVRFRVRNIGQPMTTPQPYIVVEDNVMFLQNEAFQIGSGGEFELSLPANGSTWRLEVLQAPGTADWLSDPHVAAVVEGCSVTGGFSTGYVNQFSLYDGAYFSEKECRLVVANAQGNEKTAYPAGWNIEHLIQPNTDLEYEIHFQNTSGDTIKSLSFRDTLDHVLLDPSSVLPGPASHAYQFDLSGTGVLTFRLIGATLADSARAWVKFRVRQQADLPPGTVIYNRAWAYPDFDSPIPTDETYHTLGQVLLSGSSLNPMLFKPLLQVWPVPTSTDLRIDMNEYGHYLCQVTNPSGHLVLNRHFSGTSLRISDQELPTGVFVVAIFQDGRRVALARAIKLNP
ncbi:MAG: PQQ-binding-like beta-propeller repeat protein [Saprospiraceae bacterium]